MYDDALNTTCAAVAEVSYPGEESLPPSREDMHKILFPYRTACI
jgi:hypothetical protein